MFLADCAVVPAVFLVEAPPVLAEDFEDWLPLVDLVVEEAVEDGPGPALPAEGPEPFPWASWTAELTAWPRVLAPWLWAADFPA